MHTETLKISHVGILRIVTSKLFCRKVLGHWQERIP